MADINKNNKETELDDRELSEVNGGVNISRSSGQSESFNLNTSIRRIRRYKDDAADAGAGAGAENYILR